MSGQNLGDNNLEVDVATNMGIKTSIQDLLILENDAESLVMGVLRWLGSNVTIPSEWVSTKSRYDLDLGYINVWFGSYLDHHKKVSTKSYTDPNDSNGLFIGVEETIKNAHSPDLRSLTYFIYNFNYNHILFLH